MPGARLAGGRRRRPRRHRPPDVSIGPADGPAYPLGPTIDFLHTSDAKAQKLRLHIDLRAGDRGQAAELQRLLALGARPVDIGQGPEVGWHVLADPEGNEFCLLRDLPVD